MLKHLHAVQNLSMNPRLLNEHATYDFSTSAKHTDAPDQVEVEPIVWTLYLSVLV